MIGNKMSNIDVLDAISVLQGEMKVSRNVIIEIIESAFAKVASEKYGTRSDIHAKMDAAGNISIYRNMKVVEKVEDENRECETRRAKLYVKDPKIGDTIIETLPTIQMERIVASKIKDILVNSIADIQKSHEYNEYKDRVGELVTAVVKRVSKYEVMMLIGKTEAIMPSDQKIPIDRFNIDDKVLCCVHDVIRDNFKPQVILSRTSNDFVSAVMHKHIPELSDSIRIMSIGRDPGYKTKVAVMSADARFDPVGACIGQKGARIKSVIEDVGGERIDIMEWSENLNEFIKTALQPAEISSIKIDQVNMSAEVIVNEANFSLAIGRKGQNVRLCSKMTGYKIDVMLDSQRQEKSRQKFEDLSQELSSALNLELIVSQLLVAEGFSSIELINSTSIDALARIDGFDIDIATEIKNRAEKHSPKKSGIIKSYNTDKEISELPFLTKEMIQILSNNEVKSIHDIAGLASDELSEILDEKLLSREQIDQIIMIARKYCYNI